MTVPYSVNDNDVVLPADVNQYKKMIEGASGYTTTYDLHATANTDFNITLGDSAGVRKFNLKDSAGNVVYAIDSDGATTSGPLTPSSLILPTSAAPSQTAEGSIFWDSDDDIITVGTSTATKKVGLARAAAAAATALSELVFDSTIKAFKVWDGATSRVVGGVSNYKSATQAISASTTYVDVIGVISPSTFSFAIAANEVWAVTYYLPAISFGSTGGVKFQLTGPAAPTSVHITGLRSILVDTSPTDNTSKELSTPLSPVTAFSTDIAAASSIATTTSLSAGNYYNSASTTFVTIQARIINGSTAGTVTLQVAQNSATSTTTLSLGSTMRAERLA